VFIVKFFPNTSIKKRLREEKTDVNPEFKKIVHHIEKYGMIEA